MEDFHTACFLILLILQWKRKNWFKKSLGLSYLYQILQYFQNTINVYYTMLLQNYRAFVWAAGTIQTKGWVSVTVCTRHTSNFKVRHSAILGNDFKFTRGDTIGYMSQRDNPWQKFWNSQFLGSVATGFLPTRQPAHFTPKQLHRRELLILSHQL